MKRSDSPSTKACCNQGIWLVTTLLLLLQLAIINMPLMKRLFETVPLPLTWWLVPLATGACCY
ncbi:cation transporting ATPase C-terminal domain-containing protein [Erwinia tracheiphila]|uniref:cation transporting ATPase C-terminal domain-containing protein n=1 Tax=Erwinia tracheiphila TaxID=65700 RepID=UPI00033F4B56|nr:cation transporting ATPase C-terminal domain-containing protein [Erwinia tracheiphila]EOS94981.1 Putative cation-transporting P-type ATPase [Erwinia tracheiphila PSU-1]